ncbi:MAG: hypothetical protein AB1671_03555 [Thermodesulfobacteriota bacterium]|jgi:putative transposase
MPYDTPELTEPEGVHHAWSTLHDHLPLHAEGYTCTTDDLFKVLRGVAGNRGTLEAVCADLVGTPNPQTIRGYLNEQLRVEEVPELERHLNAALAAELPPRVRRHAQEVAIDYHDRPYYGKGAQAEELWGRGQAKEGTTRFYRVATAYVVLKGLRLTLALRFVLPDDDTVSVVAALLTRVKQLGIAIACLRLDKGFASIAVMAYLTRQHHSALIACPIRGTRGGTRALCQGRRSYCTTHTLRGEPGREFTAAVAVCGCSRPRAAPSGSSGGPKRQGSEVARAGRAPQRDFHVGSHRRSRVRAAAPSRKWPCPQARVVGHARSWRSSLSTATRCTAPVMGDPSGRVSAISAGRSRRRRPVTP